LRPVGKPRLESRETPQSGNLEISLLLEEEDKMQPAVWHAISLAGIAGFFWSAVLYELIRKNWGRALLAIFCACAISYTAYLAALRF
jgi:hypothetical protein